MELQFEIDRFDDKVVLDCGCSFDIVGPPPFSKSPLPGIWLDYRKLPDCQRVWDLLATGRTKGVFQLESHLGRSYSKKLKPESLEHLCALGSILRPGALRNYNMEGVSVTDLYCLRKNGEKDVEYDYEVLKPILEKTYGVNCFQEQSMAIAVELCDFTEEESDNLRKSIGKKLPAEMAKVKRLFIERAAIKGLVTKEQAEQIFAGIEASQRYQFNRCASFDTRITRGVNKFADKNAYTIEHMYRVKNDISYAKSVGQLALYKKWKGIGNYGKGLSLCEDGRIRPNIIRDIQPAGIRKVYRLKLVNGSSIKVTENHKFPTNLGEMTLREIISKKNEVKIYVCGDYEPTDFKPIFRFSNVTLADRKMRIGTTGSFTNGSYKKYNQFRKSTPNVCFICGCDDSIARIETHHINGDRTNSEASNLQKLCSSCHKKEQYKLGRVKRVEKGYPVHLIDIDSIEELDEVMTYDVTMDAPNHNFVVESGIVTSNSHAYCYAVSGYRSAFLKAHFPVIFYASWLGYAKDKPNSQEEIKDLINEAKLDDIDVYPPDLFQLQPEFAPDGKDITFGLVDIKGVGYAELENIFGLMKRVEEEFKPIKDWRWIDFLIRCAPNIKKNAMEAIIVVGALRRFRMDRNHMLYEYNQVQELTKKELEWCVQNYEKYSTLAFLLTDLARPKKEGGGAANKNRIEIIKSLVTKLNNPSISLKDDPNEISLNEERYLGAALTCSRVDGKPGERYNTTCKEFLNGKNGPIMIFKVCIDEIRRIKIKRGKEENIGREMAFLKISDGSCQIDSVMAFPDLLDNNKDILLEGNIVELHGERPHKRDGLIIKQVWSI